MPVVRTAVKNTPSNRASLLAAAAYRCSSSITPSLNHRRGADTSGNRTARPTKGKRRGASWVRSGAPEVVRVPAGTEAGRLHDVERQLEAVADAARQVRVAAEGHRGPA